MLIREVAPDVLARISAKSLPTYRTGIRRLVETHGELELDDVRLPHLEAIRDAVQTEAGELKVRRAASTGRALRAYDPDAHGKGAAENCVRAVRFFFRYCVDAGYLTTSPAERLRPPRRPPAPERPLTTEELADVWRGALCDSSDPELDTLLLTFLRHTAARREGCLNMTIDHLDLRDATVTLTEKNGESRRLPLSPEVMTRILKLATLRGARRPGDHAFRYRNGRPLTRRRFNTIFDRVDRNCGWTQALDVGAHWIRHTTLADVAAVSDIRVAAAFAGHADSSLGVIGRYTKVTFEDLAAAYEALFGPRGPVR